MTIYPRAGGAAVFAERAFKRPVISFLVLLLLVVFISTNIAVLVLRRDAVEHPHFRVWTLAPVLGLASCVLLLTQQSARVWLFAAALLAVGAVLYLIAAKSGRTRESEPMA